MTRRFDAAFDVIDGALRECSDEGWTAPLWFVDPREMWVPDLWYWARDNDVSFWHANWGLAARAAREVIAAGGEPRAATDAALRASGAEMPSGIEPQPLRPAEELQECAAFFRVAFHALFHCDMRLNDPDQSFEPPAPFSFEDEDPPYRFPPGDKRRRTLDRQELLAYAAHCRRKARLLLSTITPELERKHVAHWNCDFKRGLYNNLAHLEEHGRDLMRGAGDAVGQRTPD